jgi:hypothetical protein
LNRLDTSYRRPYHSSACHRSGRSLQGSQQPYWPLDRAKNHESTKRCGINWSHLWPFGHASDNQRRCTRCGWSHHSRGVSSALLNVMTSSPAQCAAGYDRIDVKMSQDFSVRTADVIVQTAIWASAPGVCFAFGSTCVGREGPPNGPCEG